MPKWAHELSKALSDENLCVLVTVARARGSTPRESGAKMVVTASRIFGTIGGGNLEAGAIRRARMMLTASSIPQRKLESYALGPSLAQCCGGSVDLLFEPIAGELPSWAKDVVTADESGNALLIVRSLRSDAAVEVFQSDAAVEQSGLSPGARREAKRLLSEGRATCSVVRISSENSAVLELFCSNRTPLVLFGAGHVGRAIVRVLDELPIRVTWVDSRLQEFPSETPVNVEVRLTPDPLIEADKAEPGSQYLILTHSHQLDLALCARILERGDSSFLGLIGSKSKRKRFEGQLRAAGFPPDELDRLICPIGIADVKGKRPAEIAIAVAAQLLAQRWQNQV